MLEANPKAVRARLKAEEKLCTGRDTLHWGVIVGRQNHGNRRRRAQACRGRRHANREHEHRLPCRPAADSVVYATCRYAREDDGDIICTTEIHDEDGNERYATVTQRQVEAD
ncbi:MAG: hypothetical protein R3E83_03100 [Burkholderiaceae bacterium]